MKMILNITDQKSLNNAISYAKKTNTLYRISKGIYATSKDYSRKEFANKYRQPSYISLYTVLKMEGIIFQPYTSIYAITTRSEKKEIDGYNYIYRKIRDSILLNRLGIEYQDNISIAVAERAICDTIYLNKNEYFDNLRTINWEFLKQINTEVFENSSSINKFIDANYHESTKQNNS